MDTLYAIYNSDGSLVFVNNNTACFYEIFEFDRRVSESFNNLNNDNAKSLFADFMSDKYLEFVVDGNLSKKRLKSFLEKIGKFEILPFNSNDPIYIKHTGRIGTAKYKVRTYYNDFESPEKFKFAIHRARIAIENPYFIDNQLLNEKPDGIDFWQWMRILATHKQIDHNYFSLGFGNQIAINYPIEIIFEKLKETEFRKLTNVYWHYQAEKETIKKEGESFLKKEEVISRQIELARKHYLEYHKKEI